MSHSNRYSFQSFIQFLNQHFGLLLLAAVVTAAGFVSGSLWTENRILKAGTSLPSQVAAGTQPTQLPPEPGLTGAIPAVTDNEPSRGNKNAAVTLVEYSDFECPYCARFHPTLQQVMKDYGDKVRWVYRHYPLPFHPNAQKAAEGSECVAKLGGNDAFWKYADAIIAENDKLGGKLTPESIPAAAAIAGVNASSFKTCLDSGEMAAKVKEVQDKGSAAGISGTPGTVVITKDGTQTYINGAQPIDQVKLIIDSALEQS